MTSPQPHAPCSRAAQDYAFTLFDDPFSDDWVMCARSFDAGRVHMTQQMLDHPSFGRSVQPYPVPPVPYGWNPNYPMTVTCSTVDVGPVRVDA
jgi:hypothetical protein